MPLPRLLILIVGITLVLGLMLWFIDALRWFYLQISYTSPLLGTVVLLLIVALLGVLLAGVIYYAWMFQGGKTSKSGSQRVVKVPTEKKEAAAETLKAVRQQMDKIQDRVAREALLERSRQIESSLQGRNVRVVVFGTGSSGKTSVINGLLGQMVGQVQPTIGTTQEGQTYHLPLRGLNREILITDTPGILEIGEEGSDRAQIARQLATQADLLLFVVDNDLRQSEYEPLQALAQIGKRSLLVFNKTDLYTDEDQERILSRLRQRVQRLMSSSDVLAIAANPQAAVLPSGDLVVPDPVILPLIRRLAAVLRAEGEDLVADNILMQASALGDDARRILDTQRKRQADKTVEQFQWIGAGAIAVTPLPVVDLLATAAVNAQMVIELGRIYGCELNMERGRELALSLAKTLTSLGIVEGALKLVTTALQLNVATFIIGKAIQGVTAAYLTRIAGKSFIEYFRQDQDWGDGGITEVVQRQFKLNKRDEFVKAFIQDAIDRVVHPLTQATSEPSEENDSTALSSSWTPPISSLKVPEPLPPNLTQQDDWSEDLDPERDDW
ncbi:MULTISPECIES: GTP-binding protein [unclassified Roseofilum]|uniref:YcjF family protein n=1 Tax=unclassified Roseofilum TaxID=2620099 RepID=UPI000E871EDF|nr:MULTISPECIES: GTP-binding protein [unclassified Roseofilum]MBP0008798.1 GTP-binding protein [Roseofilum sp. Belize Diploria]MBP0032295.1 GTP-binding protein [Roseofilum sp. Belize BBD 4]HBQ97769.1 GTP-binding protein [Cyanobacteria bacterium UBA11691]